MFQRLQMSSHKSVGNDERVQGRKVVRAKCGGQTNCWLLDRISSKFDGELVRYFSAGFDQLTMKKKKKKRICPICHPKQTRSKRQVTMMIEI
jgi:hypothetical protein